ncbi:MAG: hypothetical protein BWZ01_02147 [Deltaproteobacteria bacterium ADurb.BinA179]|nr:MAG: hypothetical protein BWZ01_02147 [Deltaproteobacteria bacterium ADurb.BinA179]
MKLRQIDAVRAQAGDLVGLLRETLADIHSVEISVCSRSQHRGPYPDRPGSGELLQVVLGAQNGCGRTVSHRSAHRPGQRIGHRFRCQNIFDGHILLILRLGVHRSVPVIFGAYRSQLALGGPEGFHVPSGSHGIGVHEDAPTLARGCLAVREPEVELFVELHEHVDVRLEVLDIHAGGVRAQRERLVLMGDLFRAQRHHHIIHPGSNGHVSEMQRRRCTGTGVFAVDDGNALESHIPEHDLAPYRVLVGEHAPEGIRHIGGLDVILLQPGVIQNELHGFVCHAPDCPLRVLAESDHAHTDDVHVIHKRCSLLCNDVH